MSHKFTFFLLSKSCKSIFKCIKMSLFMTKFQSWTNLQFYSKKETKVFLENKVVIFKFVFLHEKVLVLS